MNFFINLEFRLGKLTKLMGKTIPKSSSGAAQLTPEDVIAWWTAVAYRQGEGDVWADGTTRAANALGLGDEVWKTHKHGYGPHWDGRYMQYVRSPVWINSALTWAIHGRDPHNHEHDIPERYTTFVKDWGRTTSMWGTPALPYTQMCDLGRQLYGEFFPQGQYFLEGWDAGTAKYQYTDKEFVTLVHNYRGMIKDSVPVCDRLFPLLYDTASDPPKIGHFSAETDIFNAIAGTTWTLKDMHKSADKALNIQRAIMVMQGRTRTDDESVIPYFSEQKDNWPNDAGPQTLDPVKFKDLLSRYYAVKGWDSQGRPKRAILESLGLKDVADKLASLNLLGI
jgi:aldehyde:ferredoxin oxidoreductase